MKSTINPNQAYLSLLLLLCSMGLFAQEPEKFGKVPEADLSMTVYEPDSSATAVVLFDVGNVDFDFNRGKAAYIFKRHKRIKILDRSAFDYGDIAISYYSDERVSGLNAMVHNPDGSTEKLRKKDFFTEPYNENWTQVKFSFPDLQEGSIIEYEYEYYSPYLQNLPEWFFQYEIPVRWSQYDLDVPEWYDYTGITQGRPLDISEYEGIQRRYNVSINNGAQASQRGTANLQVSRTHLVMKEVPALKEEPYITNMDDYRARVRYQLKATRINQVYDPHMTDWNQLSERLMESDYFGKQIELKRNFKDINAALKSQLGQASSEVEKAAIIYHHINNMIEWNGEYGIYTDDKLGDCYEQKIASAGDMNLLLLGMLRQEGITAYPVLVSTRENGKMLQLYPILSQFNHVMVVALFEEQQLLLDLGDAQRPMGLVRSEALNGNIGLLVDPENAQWIKIPMAPSKTLHMAKVTMDEEGKISGSMSELLGGYAAVSVRNVLDGEDAKDWYEKSYTEEIPDIEITKVEVPKSKNISKDFRSKMEFSIPNSAMINGDFIYFSPVINPIFEENPLKLEERAYPVDFNYPINHKYIMAMELPEGYALESAPEPINMALPDHGAIFRYSVNQVGSILNINSTLEINKTTFLPDEYAGLKKFFDLIVEKQTEQLVLRYGEE